MEFNISNDTWATILSYLKEIWVVECVTQRENDPVNPEQFIAIMKMSFVNKSLRNMITSNIFWILYNSIEYESAKYNIYDCNENFCRIISKIRIFNEIKDIEATCNYVYNSYKHIFGIMRWCSGHYIKKCNISSKEIVSTHSSNSEYKIDKKYKCNKKYKVLSQNEYCTLVKGIGYGNNYYITKPNKTYDGKCDNFYISVVFNGCDLLTYSFEKGLHIDTREIVNFRDVDAILHDNYIWFTTEMFMANDPDAKNY